MSKITQEGKHQVLDAYEDAVNEEDKLKAAYDNATERTRELHLALSCKHDVLEDAGALSFMQTRCTKCGFVWSD